MERLKICGWNPTRSMPPYRLPILASVQQIVQQQPRHRQRPARRPQPQAPRLLDRLRGEIRMRHHSIGTESAYVEYARRFILFHGKRHPKDMGALEVEAFLTWLSVERNVAAAIQNQARSAQLFFTARC